MAAHPTRTPLLDATRTRVPVLGVAIDALSWGDTIERMAGWAARGESRAVCICNSHSVVTGSHDAVFGAALQQADLATPDGAPVAWMMRRLGHTSQTRINGPDLMWRYLAHAAAKQEPIFLYGNTEATLALLQQQLHQQWPGLPIAGAYSPPFRALTAEEEAAVVDLINASGARTVWVSLGCPKQELWMASMRGRIQAVMVGVGAAFDFHAGSVSRAPQWMRNNGLEWLHRLASEPRRLWRRYLVTNTAFIWGAAKQLLLPR